MKWPKGFEPENSRVYARNEITIAAPPERVWRWLIRAANWPAWYSNSSNVRFQNAPGPDLALGTNFIWKTFGATVNSTVLVFDPPHELGWDGKGLLPVYHGWLLEPSDNGCRVVTEECQNGVLGAIGSWYLRPMLLKGHQVWLESLKKLAEGGDPT